MTRTLLLSVALLVCGSSTLKAQSDYAHLYQGLPFEMPVVETPSFGPATTTLAAFGGVADGITLNTEAFAKALSYLEENGGGTLNVEGGIWFTGPIELKSNINLHLADDAVILFSSDLDLYDTRYVTYEGFEGWRTQSPLSGYNLENVAITGGGIIDGNGDMWRPIDKKKLSSAQWRNIISRGGIVDGDIWYPSQGYIDGMPLDSRRAQLSREEASQIKHYLRPVMVQLVSCRNVLLKDVTFQNSPAWNVHPLMCENLIVDGVFIKNPEYAMNGDGIDVESCRNVIIYRSVLDVGDDAICLKSGKDEAGRRRGIPTENVIVRDCRVFHGHGGFVVGSEMSGGVKNVSVSDCQFAGTDCGLRFKSTRGRGGVVSNIHINDVSMLNIIGDAITFDLYYWVKNAPTEIPPVDETTPRFCDIYINGITSYFSGKAVKFNGIPEMPIDNIHVSNSYFTAREGGLLSESENIQFTNVTIIPESGAAMTINNVNNATFSDCRFVSPQGTESVVYSGKNSNVKF